MVQVAEGYSTPTGCNPVEMEEAVEKAGQVADEAVVDWVATITKENMEIMIVQ